MATSPTELSSWKEIAAFLGVSIKTAQLWEQDRGLPVHRIPGGRARVWADPAELNAWKRNQAPGPPPAGPAGRTRWAAGAGLALGVLGLAWWAVRPDPPSPAGVIPDAHGLTAIDAAGQRLWRYATPPQSSLEWMLNGNLRRLATAEDLDGDGRREVLYAPQLAEPPHERTLRCLASDGRERWRHEVRRTVRTAAGSYPPPYLVSSLLVLPKDRTGQRRVLVVSIHHDYYPTQVALLDASGRVLREYWHTGHLHATALHRWRGRNVVLLAGTNNTTRQATLVVLDPETMEGASQESDRRYLLAGFPRGREALRLLFPRTCLNRESAPMSTGTWLSREGEGWVLGVDEIDTATVNHHFDGDLQYRSSDASSLFVAMHEQRERAGRLDHRLTEDEIAALRPVAVTSAP